MQLAKNIIFVINLTLASWILAHSLYQMDRHSIHIFSSFEIEEKTENLLEDKEDVDHEKFENMPFLSHSFRGYNTNSYSSPYISLFDVPPEHLFPRTF